MRTSSQYFRAYYVRGQLGESLALKNELPNLEPFCETTRQQVDRARAIDQGSR